MTLSSQESYLQQIAANKLLFNKPLDTKESFINDASHSSDLPSLIAGMHYSFYSLDSGDVQNLKYLEALPLGDSDIYIKPKFKIPLRGRTYPEIGFNLYNASPNPFIQLSLLAFESQGSTTYSLSMQGDFIKKVAPIFNLSNNYSDPTSLDYRQESFFTMLYTINALQKNGINQETFLQNMHELNFGIVR